MDNNQALHEAISNEDMEKFLQLLDQPDIDVNYKNGERNTPLIVSIKRSNPKCRIQTGCDVNLRGNDDDTPPLHVAFIVHMLIKKGADVNASGKLQTPLHNAISNEDAEVTSMLLYYEADVNIKGWMGLTPLMESFLAISRRDCQEILLKYYDDFSCCDEDGKDALHLATDCGSPFVVDLIERGADVNTVDSYGRCLIYKTVYNDNAKAFKCIWSRMNHKLTLERDHSNVESFFLYYLDRDHYNNISDYEYLECLYLMLESPIAHLLIKDATTYRFRRLISFVSYLLEKLVDRKVLPKDRLSLIYACLSFGIEIKIEDLEYAYEHWGFNEEFKALLCAGNLICSDYAEQIKHCMKLDYYTKGFSSLSLEDRQHIIIYKTAPCKRKIISKSLVRVPEFPSLLELCRNKVQKCIQKEFEIAKLYQFQDAVNCLKLPQIVNDIILLKQPIYTNLVLFTNMSDNDDDEISF